MADQVQEAVDALSVRFPSLVCKLSGPWREMRMGERLPEKSYLVTWLDSRFAHAQIAVSTSGPTFLDALNESLPVVEGYMASHPEEEEKAETPAATPADSFFAVGGKGVAGLVVSKSDLDRIGDDRILKVDSPEGATMLFLADGATGTGFGDKAAEAACRSVERLVREHGVRPGDEAIYLGSVDSDVAHECMRQYDEADTTGILLTYSGSRISGASAGDSRAIIVFEDRSATSIELTVRQNRKPRLGAGAQPVGFTMNIHERATVVIASDGLWNFTTLDRVEAAVRNGNPTTKVDRLMNLVRDAEGRYRDDTAIIVLEVGP